jgi:hypothetical protein
MDPFILFMDPFILFMDPFILFMNLFLPFIHEGVDAPRRVNLGIRPLDP